MKNLMFALFALVVGCDRIRLPDAVPEKGGVTFDFEAISAKRFAHVFDGAKNLAKPDDAALLKKKLRLSIPLAHTNGGLYTVSCRYRMKHTAEHRSTINFKPDYYCGYVLLETGGEWKDVSHEVLLPRGAKTLDVSLNVDPKKSAYDFKDLVVLEQPTPALRIRTLASELMDSTFALSEGQAVEFCCYWMKTDRTRQIPVDRCSARIELPAGVEYMSANWADAKTVKAERAADGSSVVTFKFGSAARQPDAAYVGWNIFAMVLKATGRVGECGTGRVTVVCDDRGGRLEASTAPIAFRIIPRVSCARPKTYANGIMPNDTLGQSFAAQRALSQSFADAGVTWMAAHAGTNLYAVWRQMGITRITPCIHPVVNGYEVCSWDKIPESDRFVAVDPRTGKPQPWPNHAVCPVTVYEKSEYFRTKTVPFIRNFVKGADGCWSNWEPGAYAGRGCMCDRCCRKFAEYLKKPYGEIKAIWPKCVIRGGKYEKEVKAFRSAEHVKVVWTIDEVVRGASGGEKSMGFIPGIAWIEMSSWWRSHNYPPEQRQIDYAGKLRWMNPWGPYASWESSQPYVYAKRKPLAQFFAAKDIRETVNRDYPDRAARPKLMALPQGQQCCDWICQPEWISMGFDANFFNGFEGTVSYYFPMGYDARYYRAMAEASGRAAKYEPFVLEGRRDDAAATLTPVAGAYARNVSYLSGYLPDVKSDRTCMLQKTVYRLGDRTIVAVFNYWEKGDAYFNLKLGGLDGNVAIVDENGVLRAHDRTQPYHAAAELAAKGVDLRVPAARCRVFEFRPATGDFTDAKSVLTDEALKNAFENARDELEREAERDAAYEKGTGPVAPDYFPVI